MPMNLGESSPAAFATSRMNLPSLPITASASVSAEIYIMLLRSYQRARHGWRRWSYSPKRHGQRSFPKLIKSRAYSRSIRRIYGYHFCIHRQLSHPSPCVVSPYVYPFCLLLLSHKLCKPLCLRSRIPAPATISTKLSIWQKKPLSDLLQDTFHCTVKTPFSHSQ